MSRRLHKLEALRELSKAALPPLIYDILDEKGLSVGNYLIAGKKYGELRPATDLDLAVLRTSHLLRS